MSVCVLCGQPIDPIAGDRHPACSHPEAALPKHLRAPTPVADRLPASVTAVDIIRHRALTEQFLSANTLRGDMAGVPEHSRGPAFAAAVKAGLIELSGYEKSTDPATKGHRIAVYRSLIRKDTAA
jgi:hypothetical protein